MSEESKQVDPAKEREAQEAAETLVSLINKEAGAESDDESGSDAEDAATQKPGGGDGDEAAGKKKKKKGKKNKIRQALSDALGRGGSGMTTAGAASDPKKALEGLTPEQLREFMALNPALANELLGGEGSSDTDASAINAFKKLEIQDIMTGLASSGKNRKDMASYKFWTTQPVPQFGVEEPKQFEEGPLRLQEVKDIPTEPISLALAQFHWVTMDLTNDAELEEVADLLDRHYVEDDEAMFRFKYSKTLLRWSLMPPGWKKEWHVGIRSGAKLCAFISAIPTEMRVRNNTMASAEVNFLCIHKKLRGKRLAPVLIKEITRRVNLEGVWQAIYTGGVVLPKPVSTCRYYHRAINWKKLYEVGFSPCPSNSKPEWQVRRYALPENTATRGLRAMQAKDLDAVQDLLGRYMKRFDLTPVWNKTELEHWLLQKMDPSDSEDEQILWSFVVEDADGKITDFFSFYLLESSVIQSQKYDSVRAAYLFYYATDVAFTAPDDRSALGERLNALMKDAVILARKAKLDVFNALSLMDNSLFLENQKFGPGDGQLHYYLFNYKANYIYGGVDKKNQLDQGLSSGVGFVML